MFTINKDCRVSFKQFSIISDEMCKQRRFRIFKEGFIAGRILYSPSVEDVKYELSLHGINIKVSK